VWQDRLPTRFRERGPHVVEQGDGTRWLNCDGSVIGAYGLASPMMKGYSSSSRVPGFEDDGLRPADPTLRLQDMKFDGVYASVPYGPNLFGLPIAVTEGRRAGRRAGQMAGRHQERISPSRVLFSRGIGPEHEAAMPEAPDPGPCRASRSASRRCATLSTCSAFLGAALHLCSVRVEGVSLSDQLLSSVLGRSCRPS
jgi:hypothetical protein